MPIEATSNVPVARLRGDARHHLLGREVGPRLESAPFAAVRGEEQLDVRAPDVHGENRPPGHGSSFDASRPACKSDALSGGAARAKPRADPADAHGHLLRREVEVQQRARGEVLQEPRAGDRCGRVQLELVVVELGRERLEPAAADVARSPNSGQASLLRIKAARACRRSASIHGPHARAPRR